MANTKISQLPSWTGSAADLRWFVMNNSSENETYKFSGYTSPYKIGDGTNSVVSLFNPTAYAPGQNAWVSVFGNNTTMTPGIGTFVWGRDQVVQSSTTSVLMGDQNTSIGNAYSAMIGGYQNSSDGGVGIGIIGGRGNTTTGSPQMSGIFGGQNNQINGGTHNFIGGGYNNIINSSIRNNYAIVGGADNTADQEAGYGITTGQYNTTRGRWGFTAGRNNLTNTNSGQFCLGWNVQMIGNNAEDLGVFASRSSTLDSSAAYEATLIGSYGCNLRITGVFSDHNGSTILGSRYSNVQISPSNTGRYYGSRIGIFMSNNSHIYNDTGNMLDQNTIFSTTGSTITNSDFSTILGGKDNTISGKTNAHLIGCDTRTATTDDATFVENLVVFNYSNLNYADDTAAAAGGVVLGQVYHNNGALRIRIV